MIDGASRAINWPRRSNRCSRRSIVRMPSLNGYSYRIKGRGGSWPRRAAALRADHWPRNCSIARGRWPHAPSSPCSDRDSPEPVHMVREFGQRDSVVVNHRVGTGATLASSRLLGDDRARCRLVPARPRSTRSTWVVSSQSTTQTRRHELRQRPDSTSSGTSKTSRGRVGGAAVALRSIDGRSSDEGSLRVDCEPLSSKDDGAHAGAIESAVGVDHVGAERGSDRLDRRSAGQGKRRAIMSVSMTVAPRLASSRGDGALSAADSARQAECASAPACATSSAQAASPASQARARARRA